MDILRASLMLICGSNTHHRCEKTIGEKFPGSRSENSPRSSDREIYYNYCPKGLLCREVPKIAVCLSVRPSVRPFVRSSDVRPDLFRSLSEQPKWSHLRDLVKKGDQNRSQNVKSVSRSTWDLKESDYRSEWRMARHRSQVRYFWNPLAMPFGRPCPAGPI